MSGLESSILRPLVERRLELRKQGDFYQADIIRHNLQAGGIELQDFKQGGIIGTLFGFRGKFSRDCHFIKEGLL